MPRKPKVFSLYGKPKATVTSNKQARERQARRKYPTYSKTWRRIRESVLAGEPLCRHCQAKDRLTEATDVDHIDNDSHNNERSNLQPLCKSCHSAKTATERAQAAG